MRTIGIILIVLGLLGFVVGGISSAQDDSAEGREPVEVQREEERRLPVGPVASAVAVIAGVVLVAVDRPAQAR